MFEKKEYLEQPKYVFEFSHFVFALLFIILGSVYYNLAFIGYTPYKITAFTFIFFALGVLYFFKRKIKPGKTSVFILVSSLIFSLSSLTEVMDKNIELLWFLVLHLSALLFVLSVYSTDFLKDFLLSVCKSIFIPFKSFFALPLALFAPLKNIERNPEKKYDNITFIIIGILISIPLIIIVCSLLLSDAFFHSFASSGYNAIIGFFGEFNLLKYINAFSLFVALYLFGAFYNSERNFEKTNYKISIPPLLSATVVIALLSFYAIFFISQLLGVIQCIFSALPDGETYSSFARSGFFNLCIVSCINGLVLYFANKRANNNFLKTLSVALSVSTLLIIGIAFSKMIIYICAFGLHPNVSTQFGLCSFWQQPLHWQLLNCVRIGSNFQNI